MQELDVLIQLGIGHSLGSMKSFQLLLCGGGLGVVQLEHHFQLQLGEISYFVI